MDLAIGELSERVSLYEVTTENEPRLGQLEENQAATPYAVRWAKVVPLSTTEGASAGGQEAWATHAVTMRLCRRATTANRLVWGGETYEVATVDHDKSKSQTVLTIRKIEAV